MPFIVNVISDDNGLKTKRDCLLEGVTRIPVAWVGVTTLMPLAGVVVADVLIFWVAAAAAARAAMPLIGAEVVCQRKQYVSHGSNEFANSK